MLDIVIDLILRLTIAYIILIPLLIILFYK